MVINLLYYVGLALKYFPFFFLSIKKKKWLPTSQFIFTSSFIYYSAKSLKAAGLLMSATWILIVTNTKATRSNECLLKIALLVTKIKCLVNVMHKINWFSFSSICFSSPHLLATSIHCSKGKLLKKDVLHLQLNVSSWWNFQKSNGC